MDHFSFNHVIKELMEANMKVWPWFFKVPNVISTLEYFLHWLEFESCCASFSSFLLYVKEKQENIFNIQWLSVSGIGILFGRRLVTKEYIILQILTLFHGL